MSCVDEFNGGVAADVACAACDEDVHGGVLCGWLGGSLKMEIGFQAAFVVAC